MNKTELVKAVAERAGISQAQAKAAVEATTASIADALVKGDAVQLIGFGTFAVKNVPARKGINPATNEPIEIAAKNVVKFKPGTALADAVK